MSAKLSNVDQFKRNDDEFRNTMEAIFQKYSSLNDPGIEVCLKTMTCRTERGPVPIDSAEGERELEALKTRLKDHSMREFVDQDDDDDQMDVSGVTEDDLNDSDQTNNQNLWHGGDSFQLSMNVISSSQTGICGLPSQPEEEDEELEKTLSSHGSTLLDVYPSMLNQIGEAYRRQHVTDTARAVLQKYRRKHWQAGQAHPHNTSFKKRHSGTLNNTTEISFTKQSPVQRNNSSSIKGSIKLQDLFKNKMSSPLKNSSYEASACFYSPRRDSVDESVESPRTNMKLNGKPKQNSVCVIDFTTPPYSVSPLSDQSPDLNQTYDIGPFVSSNSHVPGSLVSNSPRPALRSQGKGPQGLSLDNWRGMSITSQPSYHQPAYSSLDKDCFRDRLHSPVSSPQRGVISCFSPSGKCTFRPTLLRDERQQSRPTAIQSPKRMSPVCYLAQSEVHRSPYGGKQVPSSPQRPLYNSSSHQQHFSMAEKQSQISPRPYKSQRTLSEPQSTCLSKCDSFREPQIDAEFRKLYHHFICRGTSSPCPTSHCHLCERQLKETSQSPSFSSASMSALALTPLRSTHKKRHRQYDVEESLRFKRFRESRSPLKHLQLLPYQLKDRYMSSDMSEPSEDKHAWDRAVLLQCPSPRFLRGTGNLRKIREAKLAMQMNPHAMSWRDVPSGVNAFEAQSPIRTFNQGMVPLSPSLSRRRLQYGLLQR
ncbi:uncharacterized protein LOC127410006 [Myxocyprinus asiaticus]|uniref:uncharacterized protein LOC127410006 n=1 Tax=Myxocyprinus asiaticus TaxID=70543 RepID=UPI0022226057|nr:uncharacterized protein LOC127410006 [Myxocyprinus asiaticus]